MADYDYEEGGFMALYFVLTFLTIVLIPLTSSYLLPSFSTQSIFIFTSDTDLAKGKNRQYAANVPSA
jgi:preprotein translocase subunit Sec63